MSSKYTQLAEGIVRDVGGKENIAAVTHCVSRLRFNLKDQGLADIAALEGLKGAVGVKLQNNQVQVVIGQHVGEVYEELCKISGIQGEAQIDEFPDKRKRKITPKSILNSIVDSISGSISPLIPLLIGASMFKVALQLLGPGLLNFLSVDSGTYAIFSLVGDAGFYFLPIFIGASAAKKFNAHQGMGMLMGAILMSPTLISLVNEGASLTIYGIPVYPTSYANSVLPAIMIVWVMSYVYRFFTKICPNFLKSLLVPLATLLVMLPIALCVLGPLGVIVGNYITTFFLWLYEVTGAFGVAVLAAVYPFLIMTGMHATLVPTFLLMFAELGYEPFILTANLCANMAIGGTALAIAVKSKNVETKSAAATTSLTAIVGGVTEPALFGFVLRFKRPLIGMMLGGFAGGLFAGLMKVLIYVMPGTGGIFVLPSYIGENNTNVVFAAIAFVISIVVAFVSTCLIGFDEKKTGKEQG